MEILEKKLEKLKIMECERKKKKKEKETGRRGKERYRQE